MRLPTVVFVIIISGCTQPKADTKTEAEKIMQLSKEWSIVAKSGDVEKTVSYWADDAIVISPGEHPLRGKESIKKMVEGSFKIPGFVIQWQPQQVEVSESGDMAYIIEKSQVSYLDSTGTMSKQYNNAVSIWRKQADGTWKNVVDISTPEQMP